MKKKILLSITSLLVILGLVSIPIVYTAYAKTNNEHIFKGIYIESVPIGDLTKEDAQIKLDEYVKQLGEKQVTLSTDKGKIKVKMNKLGLDYSNKEVLDQAFSYGKTGNIIRRYKEVKDVEKEPVVLELEKSIDTKALNSVLKKEKAKLVQSSKNASLTRNNGKFKVLPEKNGLKLDTKTTQTQFLEFLNTKWDGKDFDFAITTVVEEPKYKTQDMEKVKNKLGTYTTNFSSSSSDRAANVTNGANLINGTIVYPGEEFSAYKVVAPFTPENGYFIGKAYANGEVIDSIGGGICQVSTTLYNTVIRSELEVTERAPHSMTVAYVPRAADAAIAGTYKDLKFKNNTKAPIYIEGISYDRNVTFTIYGEDTRPDNRTIEFRSETLATYGAGKDIEKKDPTMAEGKTIVTQSAHIGYKAELWKDVYVDGKKTDSILVNTSVYSASPRRVTVGTKKKEVPKEDPKDKLPGEGTTTDKPEDKPNTKPDTKPVDKPAKEPAEKPTDATTEDQVEETVDTVE